MGVFPDCSCGSAQRKSFPHTRGGVSSRPWERRRTSWLSPHAWGCFRKHGAPPPRKGAFPTRVGVFPMHPTAGYATPSFPHTRGGVSDKLSPRSTRPGLSPHAWGCFRLAKLLAEVAEAFPTRVGVFPDRKTVEAVSGCFPHTRGGVSILRRGRSTGWSLSPHAWGCFLRAFFQHPPAIAFPTRVGVFLPACPPFSPAESFPHTRGGVSRRSGGRWWAGWLSPHAWGCFCLPPLTRQLIPAFPTRVGVFPDNITRDTP